MELRPIARDVYACLQEDRGLGCSNSGLVACGGGLVVDTFWDLPHSYATPPLEMHPDDARARGLREGDTVRVWNDLGEVRLPLHLTDSIRPGVVCSLKGAWFRTSDNGQTVSALAPAHHADLAEGACYNDARVEVAAHRG